MMQSGRGVTNYNNNNNNNKNDSSIGFSTETTEFDDALISRGILTFQQSMMRKGASLEQAIQLEHIHRQQQQQQKQQNCLAAQEGEGGGRNDDSDDDDTDVFLERYRKERLNELKSQATATQQQQQQQQQHGDVYIISRPEWTRHVNEDSHDCWVIVTLTSSDSERTGCIENATRQLALKYGSSSRSGSTITTTTKCTTTTTSSTTTTRIRRRRQQQQRLRLRLKVVHIAHHAAIPNWPMEHLPTLFCYRHGVLQHSLVQLPRNMSLKDLEQTLKEVNILNDDMNHHDSDSEEEDDSEEHENEKDARLKSTSSSSFQTTSVLSAHDLEDYDEVD